MYAAVHGDAETEQESAASAAEVKSQNQRCVQECKGTVSPRHKNEACFVQEYPLSEFSYQAVPHCVASNNQLDHHPDQNRAIS